LACNSQNGKSINEKSIKADSIKSDSLNSTESNIIPMPYHFLETTDSLLHIEYWGIKTDHYAIIPEAVCKKWGFEIWPTWGCEATKEQKEKIIKHNIQFNEQMKKKFGSNWKEKFEKVTGKSTDLFLRME